MQCCHATRQSMQRHSHLLAEVVPIGRLTQAENSRAAAGMPPSTGAADDSDADAAATAAAGQQGLQYLAALPPGMAPASNRSVEWHHTRCCSPMPSPMSRGAATLHALAVAAGVQHLSLLSCAAGRLL